MVCKDEIICTYVLSYWIDKKNLNYVMLLYVNAIVSSY